jgi:hypothetical protein
MLKNNGSANSAKNQNYIKYRESYKINKRYFAEQIKKLKESHREELRQLSVRQHEERKIKLVGKWRGKGTILNAQRSIIAAEQSIERQRIKERQIAEIKKIRHDAKKAIGNYISTFEDWLAIYDSKKAQIQRYMYDKECIITSEEQEITQEEPNYILIGILAYQFYSIGLNGYVYYSLNENSKPAFVDMGKKLLIYEEYNTDAVLAAMQLAVKKWGIIKIDGPIEYINLCMELADKYGIKISNRKISSVQYRDNNLKEGIHMSINNEKNNFEMYHNAVCADRYRVTCIRMLNDGSKKTFILDKYDGETKGFTPEQLVNNLQKMINLQNRGENIYLTPLSEHKHHILIDDMNRESLDRLITDGFKPAALLESSPGNYQAILSISKLGTAYDKEVGNRITERLNQTYGDKKLSGCVHPHRAPGFENRKPKYKTENGEYPKVKLLKAEPRECRKALALSQEIDAEYADMEKKRLTIPAKSRLNGEIGSPICAYYRHFDNIQRHIEIMDNSRVDAMIAVRMRATGHTQAAVTDAIRQCAAHWRDEVEKRDWQRYAERTATYAYGVAGDRELQRWSAYYDHWLNIERGEEKKSRKKMRNRS